MALRFGVDKRGYFGEFGGAFAPEVLIPALAEVEKAFAEFKENKECMQEYADLLRNYCGRPTSLYHAKKLSKALGGAQIYLKREDLNHTGAHKITNSLGQGLLAKFMGKKRIIAETGAGQHGVATATVAALLGLECDIYMGTVDMARQSPNVFRMNLLGSKVIAVNSGSKTLKDAVNEAYRDWSGSVRTTHYVFGSALGPHPFPMMVADFQSIIGKETKTQCKAATNKLPTMIVACVGGGSNAIGIFSAFLKDASVKLVGVEAGGLGIKGQKHAARLTQSKSARTGIFHGMYTYVLQDEHGQIGNTHSVSAGLDYSGVGPEHAYLRSIGRVDYTYATDKEAMAAFRMLCLEEGIIPALESSHAVAYAIKTAPSMSVSDTMIVNISGRGDKDIFHAADYLGMSL